jgi:hypothetical protein
VLEYWQKVPKKHMNLELEVELSDDKCAFYHLYSVRSTENGVPSCPRIPQYTFTSRNLTSLSLHGNIADMHAFNSSSLFSPYLSGYADASTPP